MPKGVYEHTKENTRKQVEAMHRANIGRSPSAETRQKISQAHMGHSTSEETKQKIGNRYYPVGPENSGFRGQPRLSNKGYIYVYQPDNLRAKDDGYMKRADLVMEQMIGRHLYPGEITHHKNRLTQDDQPENLELFANQSAHMSFHAKAGDCFPLDGPRGRSFQKGYDPRRFAGGLLRRGGSK